MSRFFARIAISIAAMLVMVVAACIAVGYFAYALDLWLAEHMSPAAAAIVTGVAVLALAGALVAFTQMGNSRRRPSYGASDRAARETVAQLGGELGQRLLGLADTHKPGALLAALVAGFAVGVSPKLRE